VAGSATRWWPVSNASLARIPGEMRLTAALQTGTWRWEAGSDAWRLGPAEARGVGRRYSSRWPMCRLSAWLFTAANGLALPCGSVNRGDYVDDPPEEDEPQERRKNEESYGGAISTLNELAETGQNEACQCSDGIGC